MKAFDFAVQTVVSSLDHIQTGGCSMVRPGLVYYRGRQMSLRVRSWHCASTTSPHGPDNSIFAYSQPSTAIFYQRHGYWDVFQFLPIYLGFHPGVPQIAILPQRDSGLSAGAALRFDSAEWWCQGTQPGAPTKTPVGEWCCLSLFTSSATSFWRHRLVLGCSLFRGNWPCFYRPDLPFLFSVGVKHTGSLRSASLRRQKEVALEVNKDKPILIKEDPYSGRKSFPRC